MVKLIKLGALLGVAILKLLGVAILKGLVYVVVSVVVFPFMLVYLFVASVYLIGVDGKRLCEEGKMPWEK